MWLLSFLLLLASITLSYASFAAMSIDFGTQFIKVGIVKPGIPMDIALNGESRRKTPNLIMIHDGHRTFGDGALAMQVRQPHLVFSNLLDLVAKDVSHPSYELFSSRFPLHKVAKSPRNQTGIEFQIDEDSYSVETLLAMTFANAKKFTEEHSDVATIKDAVITVPVYFTPSERLAIERAAEMANLNVLQLVNDGTAAALSHGIFRRKEITEQPQRLLVFDMGAQKTTVTIVEFKLVKEKHEKQPKMTVIGVGFDRTLGGLEMTLRLREHLIELFKKTYKPKTDVRNNQRAMAKFLKEAERLKQVLSANAEHFAQIESAHEDIDVKLKVTRDDFNKLIADLEPRFVEPLEQALRVAQIPIDLVDQIVLMGAGTRVPKLQEVLQAAIGTKELGKFLNTDEAIAMGALFQAAHLSKGFKVKPFNVEDLTLFPVEVNFVSKSVDEAGVANEKAVRKTLFAANSVYPTNKKTISLTSYKDDFSISLNFGANEHLTKKQISEVGSLLSNLTNIEIGGLTNALADRKDEETEFKGVKISFQLDASGIVRTSRAEATIESKSGIVGTITDTLSGLFSSKTEEGEPTEGSADADTEGAESKFVEEPVAKEKAPTNATVDEAKNATQTNGTVVNGTNATNTTKEKPSVVRLQLSVTYPSAHVPNKYDVLDGKKRLTKFAEAERLAAARAAAENELESFAFEASLLLEDEVFLKHSSTGEQEKLTKEVARIRGWLEDDVTRDTKTSEFIDNLATLKKITVPVKFRIEQAQNLPEAISNLDQLLNTTTALVSLGEGVDESKALFDKKDRDAFKAKLDKLQEWLNGHKTKLEKKKDSDDFSVSVKEVERRLEVLNKEVDKFMRKMKKTMDFDQFAKMSGDPLNGDNAEKEDKTGEGSKKEQKNKKESKKTAEKDDKASDKQETKDEKRTEL